MNENLEQRQDVTLTRFPSTFEDVLEVFNRAMNEGIKIELEDQPSSENNEPEDAVNEDVPGVEREEEEVEDAEMQAVSEDAEVQVISDDEDVDNNNNTGKSIIPRQKYTESEDLGILEFLYRNAFYESGALRHPFVHPKGLAIWEQYIHDTNSTRKASNLASHFRKVLAPKLHRLHMSKQMTLGMLDAFSIPITRDIAKELGTRYSCRLKVRSCANDRKLFFVRGVEDIEYRETVENEIPMNYSDQIADPARFNNTNQVEEQDSFDNVIPPEKVTNQGEEQDSFDNVIPPVKVTNQGEEQDSFDNVIPPEEVTNHGEEQDSFGIFIPTKKVVSFASTIPLNENNPQANEQNEEEYYDCEYENGEEHDDKLAASDGDSYDQQNSASIRE